MKGRESFEKAFRKYLDKRMKEAEKDLKKAVKGYMKQHIYNLGGKRLLLQKGKCSKCCFIKVSKSPITGGYRGMACTAPFWCSHILKELHGKYCFVDIDHGL